MNAKLYIRAMFSAGSLLHALLCTSLIFTLFIFNSAAAQTPSFVFTAIPDQDETRLVQRFGRFAEYLSEQLEVEVRYVPVRSYAAAVTAFQNDQVQLAWFGGLSGVRARLLVPGSEAIAQGFEDQSFVTYFIAHSSTGLSPSETFPAEIANRSFTFGSMGSTSGRLMPEYFIREHFGQSPDDVFSRVGFSDNHSRTIALVQSGAYEVGAVNFQVWQTELAAGIIDRSQVDIIWETPTYPDYHWTMRGDLDARWGDGFSDRLKDSLLGLDDEELLNLFPRSSFIPTDNSQYQEILDVGREVGLLD